MCFILSLQLLCFEVINSTCRVTIIVLYLLLEGVSCLMSDVVLIEVLLCA